MYFYFDDAFEMMRAKSAFWKFQRNTGEEEFRFRSTSDGTAAECYIIDELPWKNESFVDFCKSHNFSVKTAAKPKLDWSQHGP